MKNTKMIFVLLGFSLASMTLFSCGDKKNAKGEEATDQMEKTMQDTNADADKQGKEYTSAFICPMHCAGSGSVESGECPIFGMEYVENKNYKANDDMHSHDGSEKHDHDHDHEGHNH